MAAKKETKKETAKAKDAASAQEITAAMNIGEIAMKHPETMEVFMKYGMHCLGCMASRFESLEQGCAAHGIDTAKMVKDLNAAATAAKKK
jgi:hybrid cluster-associated redox disulfide protein